MPNEDLVGDIGALNSGLSSLDKLLEKLTTTAAKFSSALSGGLKGSGGATSGSGQLRLGNSGKNMMPASFGEITPFLRMNAGMNAGYGILAGGTKMITGALGAVAGALPDVNAALGYSAYNYQAALMSGTTFGRIGGATTRMMGRGITSVGSSGQVAAMLSNSGFQFGANQSGAFGGYDSVVKSVAGAAMGFGLDNATAAGALGGLTSGGTSSALMQNFGIFTSDPTSGKRATPTQIFAMINDRLTRGGSMSREELQRALNGGFMETNIQNSGLDETQQGLLKQYMLDAAGGKYWNLSDYGSMQKRAADAGGNPTQALNAIASAQTNTLQTSSQTYVDSLNSAAKAVEGFEQVLRNLLETPAGKALLTANGFMTGLGADSSISGALGGLGQMGSGMMNIGGSVLAGYGAAKMFGGGGAIAGTAARTVGGGLLRGVGAVGGAVGVGASAVGSYQAAASGADGSSVLMGALGGAASGAMLGGSIGGPWGALIGALGGAGVSLIGSYMGAQSRQGGASSTVNSGGLTDTTATLTLIHPVKGPITTKYGQTTDAHGNALWGGDSHKAIDYGVAKGTQVVAAAAGTVSESGSGSGDRSYGNYIMIDHGNGYSTLYAHLSSILVTKGQTVAQGQPIALSGDTGYVTGPHLHFEARKGNQKINPANLGLGGGVSESTGVGTSTSSGSGSSGSSGMLGGAGTGDAPSGMSSTYSGPKSVNSYSGASVNGKVSNYQSLASNTGFGSARGSGSGVSGGQGGPGLDTSGKGNNVQINLTIAQASDAEARRFADIVKEELEKERTLSSMGRA